MWSYMGTGMGVVMALLWVIVAVGIIVIAWALARAMGLGGAAGGSASVRALHILEERYARGEIGREEFEQKKHDLGR